MNADFFDDSVWFWVAVVLVLVILALLGQPHVKPADLIEPGFWADSAGRAIASLIQGLK